MDQWIDSFTGVIFKMGEKWQKRVRCHLATQLAERLKREESHQKAADAAARFWQDYYSWIVPLRFGRSQDTNGLCVHQDLFKGEGPFDLEARTEDLRCGFLDGAKLPPILPSDTGDRELIADHLLITALLINLLLRQQKLDKENPLLFHQIRLGTLVYELIEEQELNFLRERHREAWQTAMFLRGKDSPPKGVGEEILRAAHQPSKALQEKELYIVVGAAQRIKQYVFETPGLNEIRGASTLLDELTNQFAEKVKQELGPEVVLRTAASTVEFLASHDTDSRGVHWDQGYRQYIFSCTGTAFVAAAATKCSVQQLSEKFEEVMKTASADVGADRYKAELPMSEVLPFEQRCSICHRRPAEGWYTSPENEQDFICSSCRTKRAWGQEERATKAKDILDWLRLVPKDLGVKGEKPKDYVAKDLKELIPEKVRRRLISVIYGDGNNFGGVMKTLKSLERWLQWTHRVTWTTKAAVALALAYATQKTAKKQGWSPGSECVLEKLPFQVLALGGDDLSLLTVGQTGLWFCQRFLELTDLEFQRGSGEAEVKEPICFSLGALCADEKAPVRRTVEFAEGELMKWAKRAFKANQSSGNVAFLLAMTAEQIPVDLQEHLHTMFLRTSGEHRLCLTLSPFKAKELSFLLQKAQDLTQDQRGRLYRMNQAFLQLTPSAAVLHYLYQKRREEKGGFIKVLESAGAEDDLWKELFGLDYLPAWPSKRLLFGELEETTSSQLLFSPLGDLLEIVKILE